MSTKVSNGGRGSMEAQKLRRSKIARLVVDNGSMGIDDLSEHLGVSAMTIYRDVAALEEMGLVTLSRGEVHGLASTLSEASATFRVEQNKAVKIGIAKATAELIPVGSSIILDDSTSCLYLLEELLGRGPFYVITNSLLVAALVADTPDVRLQVAGGEYEKWARALTGSSVQRAISEVNADFCFLSASGISGTSCYHPYFSIADIKRAMIAAADTSILLVDHTKFVRRSVHRFADLSDFDVVVTDSKIGTESLEILEQSVPQVIVTEEYDLS